MNIRAIVTGSTGMVGEGVLHECLRHPVVERVLAINRRPCGIVHAKLHEIIHPDFSDFSAIAQELTGYNAAFLCMGVSSIGMKEEDYRRITYDYTLSLARALSLAEPDAAVTYVSGAGTDSSEKGRSMWARVKGKTENDLMALFRRAYMFRPAYIQPTPGLAHAYKIHKVIVPLYPLLKRLAPNYTCTLEEIGLAMINCARNGYAKRILEVPDIKEAAERSF
ncbi:MAG: NAD-dependent epimerase/dehydratase family protein [Acidobacteriota bacterium]